MKVLICGDRNWGETHDARGRSLNKPPSRTGLEQNILQLVVNALPDSAHIIHGDARGADRLAGYYGDLRNLQVSAYPADWERHHKAAGPIRNRLMLDQRPDVVLAFHDSIASSRGTLDCITEARKRGIPVHVITTRDWERVAVIQSAIVQDLTLDA